jgi:hypothetical protein
MRRRLWWSLILFDTRIGEMADYKSIALTPTWDCKVPLNLNDCDLRPEMKQLPAIQGDNPTESIFAVVRSELADFIRHTHFHLEVTCPALKPVAKDIHRGPIPAGSELGALERMVEEKYLKLCDPEVPLHFMTIWTTRAYLAKHHLVEHYSKYSSYPSTVVRQSSEQRETATSYAVSMLECDTKIMSSPLTKGFRWMLQFYFPFPAYIHIVHDLRARPTGEQADYAWQLMSDNCEARFAGEPTYRHHMLTVFSRLLMPVWKTRQEALEKAGEPAVPPSVITTIQVAVAKAAQELQESQNSAGTRTSEALSGLMAIDDTDNFLMSMPMGFGNQGLMDAMSGLDDYMRTGPEVYPGLQQHAPLINNAASQVNWGAMDWALGTR